MAVATTVVGVMAAEETVAEEMEVEEMEVVTAVTMVGTTCKYKHYFLDLHTNLQTQNDYYFLNSLCKDRQPCNVVFHVLLYRLLFQSRLLVYHVNMLLIY